MEKIILSLLILALYFSNTTNAFCLLTKYRIGINNDIPNGEIRLHCKSGDNDLGDHTLYFAKNYEWHFCENLIHSTLFFCHFYWNSKQQRFDVFNETMADKCFAGRGYGECTWIVKPDGFYYSDFKKASLEKQYDWS